MSKRKSVGLYIDDSLLERLITDLLLMGCKNRKEWNEHAISYTREINSVVIYSDLKVAAYIIPSVVADLHWEINEDNYNVVLENIREPLKLRK